MKSSAPEQNHGGLLRMALLGVLVGLVSLIGMWVILRRQPDASPRPAHGAEPGQARPTTVEVTIRARLVDREQATVAPLRWIDLEVVGRPTPARRHCRALVRQIQWARRDDDLPPDTFARGLERDCEVGSLPAVPSGLLEKGAAFDLVEPLSADPVEWAWRGREPQAQEEQTNLDLLQALQHQHLNDGAREFTGQVPIRSTRLIRHTRFADRAACLSALGHLPAATRAGQLEVDRGWLDEAIDHQRRKSEVRCASNDAPAACQAHRLVMEELLRYRRTPPVAPPSQPAACKPL